ncbi:hypothetical protein PPTG_03579 [Phytophthora nicotianae INRA-310]|uniref:Ubiquitin-like protease family profile domain-containing protein n=2 Tax=Phytophthora nicotianae TaxID=4792 RepID=W2R7V0_PHYN3|nr:hypothetical protein PPTG_03579 [Phytophthora nicotianae INRA-310]ETN20605.1 hypothetical protein PPTG_03579 [Phytophthora nicotianae INRA-310]
MFQWYGRSRLSTQGLSKVAKPFVAKVFKRDDAAISRDRTEKEKFRRAQQAFGRISGELARLGDEAFDAAMDQFEGWWHNLRQGQISMTPCHEQTESRDNDDSNDGGNACGGGNAEDTSSVAQAISGGGSSPSSDESEDLALTQQTAVSTQLTQQKGQRAKAKADLKEYNQGMKLRGLLRDRDVCGVVSALKEIQPGILEMGAFLVTFQVLGKATPKLSMAWRLRTDIVADNVRYRLPEETVNRAFELLSESRTGQKDEIQLDSDGEGVGDENGYVLVAEKVGTYSREQVEQMKWMWNMQDTCRRGVLLCTWLNNEVKTLVDEKVAVSVAFDNFLKSWPYLVIPGFGFDITYADLFCIRGSTWLNDATMRAFCVFLKTYKNNATVMIPPVKKQTQFVLMPINLSGVHWVCLVVDGTAKKIQVYDSAGSAMYLKRLKNIASEIASTLPDMYEEIVFDGPLQTDGDSCGVFACLQLWKSVSSKAPTDVSESGIIKLRWKILQAILKVKRRS